MSRMCGIFVIAVHSISIPYGFVAHEHFLCPPTSRSKCDGGGINSERAFVFGKKGLPHVSRQRGGNEQAPGCYCIRSDDGLHPATAVPKCLPLRRFLFLLFHRPRPKLNLRMKRRNQNLFYLVRLRQNRQRWMILRPNQRRIPRRLVY